MAFKYHPVKVTVSGVTLDVRGDVYSCADGVEYYVTSVETADSICNIWPLFVGTSIGEQIEDLSTQQALAELNDMKVAA